MKLDKIYIKNTVILILLTLACISFAIIPIRIALANQAKDSVSQMVEDVHRIDTVKVGFFAYDGYHEQGSKGVKAGYGYDFLQLTKRYAGFKYDYIGYDKTWSQMLELLEAGEIDMVTAAHKDPVRAERFAYSNPIGTNSIVITVRAEDNRYIPGNFSTYKGMKIGLLHGSAANEKLVAFADANSFTYVPYYYNTTLGLEYALNTKQIDAICTSSLRKSDGEIILSSFATEAFYAIVKKDNTRLLNKINYAIAQMDNNEGDWRNRLYYKNYIEHNTVKLHFTPAEQEYIKSHVYGGKKVVLAVDYDWTPFSVYKNGTFEGIIPEYWAHIMQLAGMEYEFYKDNTQFHDFKVLQDQKVDLYLGYSLNANEAEKNGLITSPTYMNIGIAYIYRRDNKERKQVVLADSTPLLNGTLKLDEGQTPLVASNSDEAVAMVKDGKADIAYVYALDGERIINRDSSGLLDMHIVPGVDLYLQAVASEDKDHVLMSIVSKCIKATDQKFVNALVSKQLSYGMGDFTIKDWINIHPFMAVALVLGVTGIFGGIIIRNQQTKNRLKQEQEKRKIEAAMLAKQTALTDQLQESLCENEAQLEEINGLNAKLQENLCENEAQLDEIYALNVQLQDNQLRIEEANAAKSSFLFNMSHDIRTPMNAIIGFTNLLDKYQENPAKRADYLAKIKDSSAILLSIINNVLEMARIEKGTIQLDETVWNAKVFNDTLVEVYEELMANKDISFVREINVQHNYVYFDPTKLREVFMNLLSNAYKYTNPGGTVTMATEEICSDKPGYAYFKTIITDTGIGMSEEFLPHIFEEFARENNTTDNKIEGTGLGMPIVKRLVELMGGSIEVSSVKGKGSSFTVIVPHRIADEASVEHFGDIEVDPRIFKDKRILLAEDNDLNAEIAIEILTEVGFILERAEDGMVCVDMLKHVPADYYQLILMDIQMPHMNGYEATRAIRTLQDSSKSNIPIIAMTANAFEEDKRAALRAGMNGHIAKPINISQLMGILARVLK